MFEELSANLSDYRQVASSIVAKLDAIEEQTEKTFLTIGENLPEINNGLRKTESEAVLLLDYFNKQTGLLSKTNQDSKGDLSRLNAASKYLVKVASDQSESFLQMNEMMKRIENIRNSVESIRDFSAEMEMLSMNAAIVAIKAGEDGRTLNPITIELKKMSNMAIELIDKISDTSEILAQRYSKFQELSERQAESSKVDADKTSKALESCYMLLEKSISDLLPWLQHVASLVSRSHDPISKIMNILQVQDIIKQCTDHVRVALDQAKAQTMLNPASELPEQLMEVIAFQETIPNLCIQLLNDVEDRLKGAVSDLHGQIMLISKLMHIDGVCVVRDDGIGLEMDKSFIKRIEEAFEGVQGCVVETASVMQNTSTNWQELWTTAVSLEEMLGILEKQFAKLKKVTNFKQINIPIKIEVARSNELNDQELSDRVERLSDYIGLEMRQSHKEIIQDYQLVHRLVESMSKQKASVAQEFECVAVDIDNVVGSFSGARKQVDNSFQGMCNQANALAKLVKATLSDLGKINILIAQSHALKEDFKKLSELVSIAKRSLENETNMLDFSFDSELLKDIVDKFTVLSHKQIAGNMYDIDVEAGAKEGEVVLF